MKFGTLVLTLLCSILWYFFSKKRPHASVGTHGYMAPEVLSKGRNRHLELTFHYLQLTFYHFELTCYYLKLTFLKLYSTIFNKHFSILNFKSTILTLHSVILNFHSDILNFKSDILNFHSDILNFHSVINTPYSVQCLESGSVGSARFCYPWSGSARFWLPSPDHGSASKLNGS